MTGDFLFSLGSVLVLLTPGAERIFIIQGMVQQPLLIRLLSHPLPQGSMCTKVSAVF